MDRREAIRIVETALQAYVNNCMSEPENGPEVLELGKAWWLVLSEKQKEQK